MEISETPSVAVSIGEGGSKTNGKSNNKLLIYVATVMIIVASCAVIQSVFSKGSDCSSMLRDGYWSSSGQWRSHRCILHQYQEGEMSECLKRWDQVIIIGDDQARECFKTFSAASKQINWILCNPLSCQIVEQKQQFLWQPRLSEEVLVGYQHIADEVKSESALLVVHLPNTIEHTKTASSFRDELRLLVRVQEGLLLKVHKCRIILAFSDEDLVGDDREELLTVATQIYSNRTSLGIMCLKLPPPLLPSSSVSATDPPISQDLNVILNSFCNSPNDASCCVHDQQEVFFAYLTSSVAIAVLACYFGFYLIFVSGATFAIAPYLEARGFDFDKFLSVLHAVGTVAAVLLYMQMAGRLDYFSQVELLKKNWPLLCVVVFAAIVASFSTITDSEPDMALSVSQCYEWRGWMVLLLVLLHWTGYGEDPLGHAVDDLAMAGFVFLSGYCNFMKLCSTPENISLKITMQALIRLNFIPVSVSIALGTSYGVYYLAPLLSLCYLVTIIFVGAWPPLHARSSSELPRSSTFKFVAKMATIVVTFLALPYIKDMLTAVLIVIPFPESFEGDVSMLYYWIEKQRFNLLWGIFFGYLMIVVQEKSVSISKAKKTHFRIGANVSGILLLLIYLMVTATLVLSPKLQSVLGILPILSYFLLRNGFERLQKCHSLFLEKIGTICIWLVVSHRHILMAFDGKGALVLLPKLYYINLLLVLVCFILISVIVSKQLHTLRMLKNALI